MSLNSIFSENGIRKTLDFLHDEIIELYTADSVPWIVGYSGGKDSTATLQLIWSALAKIDKQRRKKPVHVISTDTLVENPIVAAWVSKSLETMAGAAKKQEMPIHPHRLTPRVEDSFWVNLIGKGYPAPRHKFRWCTERLKIKPSNLFINEMIKTSGEAILVLGTRKAESTRRKASMLKHEKGRVRERLSPNASLPGSQVYSPIEDWNNDDVWMYLTQIKNPWGYNNMDLMGMYAGASADGECPLVVDTSTPSCGDSRFGCWVCTLVEKDKSMSAMIQNDSEKRWMKPLLELRNKLDFRMMGKGDEDSTDRHLRDFRRMNGSIQLMQNGKVIPGPYLQKAREDWLRDLLKAQAWIRKHGPKEVAGIELITPSELKEIRLIWITEKHEIEDSLPKIFEECLEEPYPEDEMEDSICLRMEDLALLRELCGKDNLHYELTRELIGLARQVRSDQKRMGHFDRLEKTFSKHYFENEEDAMEMARDIQKRKDKIQAN
jgi:DNA sulfur modification protein DndC